MVSVFLQCMFQINKPLQHHNSAICVAYHLKCSFPLVNTTVLGQSCVKNTNGGAESDVQLDIIRYHCKMGHLLATNN